VPEDRRCSRSSKLRKPHEALRAKLKIASSARWATAAVIRHDRYGRRLSTARAESLSLIDLVPERVCLRHQREWPGYGPEPRQGAGRRIAFVYRGGPYADLGNSRCDSCGYAITPTARYQDMRTPATASHASHNSSGTNTDLGTCRRSANHVRCLGSSVHGRRRGLRVAARTVRAAPARAIYGAALVPLVDGPDSLLATHSCNSQGVISDLFPSPPGPWAPYFAFAINDSGEIAGDISVGLRHSLSVRNCLRLVAASRPICGISPAMTVQCFSQR